MGMKRRKNRCRRGSLKGSMTVETAFLMPLAGLVLVAGTLLLFYFHDKIIISSCAYETAVVGSTKAREKEGADPDELSQAFHERIRGKCIFFGGAEAEVHVAEDQVCVTASAFRKGIRLRVEQRAAVTEPEDHIRNLRRIIK